MRVLLLLLFLFPVAVSAEVLTGKVDWSGQRQITEKVRVAPGAKLTIAPGSRLEFAGGSIEVAGVLVAEQAEFSGEDWQGLVLQRVAKETRLTNCQISGAKIGIQVFGGEPQLQNLQLRDNQVGIELKQQSQAHLRDNLFEGNEKVGLFIKEGSVPDVSGNRFVENGKFGVYIFRSVPVRFSDNRFEQNATGLMISYFGSDPRIEDNLFVNNGIGIHVDRSAKPQLLGNRLLTNQVGIKLQRRSDAQVEGNLLQENDQGVAVLYSSYPRITANDFIGNRLAIYLEHQSSVWERVNGADRRQQSVASRGVFGTKPRQQVTEQQRQPTELNGTVDARSNWFGETAAAEIERVGENGNLSFIHDSLDQPTFNEEGKDYPLDRVRYFPVAEQPQFKERI